MTRAIIDEMYILSIGDFKLSPNDYARYDIISTAANMVTFADWLTEQMNKKKWSNADLANAAGINRQVVWGWLNRGKQPTKEMLQAVAKALGIPIEQVYRAADILPPIKEDDEWIERIKNSVDQLPPEQKELVYEYAEMLKRLANGKKKK